MCGIRLESNAVETMDDGPYEGDAPVTPRTYSHIFREHQRHVILRWVLGMARLSNDPFYAMMESTTAVRLWMVRHTPWPPEEEHVLNGGTILNYFENMGREGALRYFRLRRAPPEMIRIWEARYPAVPAITDGSTNADANADTGADANADTDVDADADADAGAAEAGAAEAGAEEPAAADQAAEQPDE